ncbi:MAG: NAD(P)H-dependent oxidoreductase [Alphaproteobacteria bacterium]|nr:NAD(P)H-dependent oxidoreductase [Alphaproteobacteria bacterium]
MRIAAVCGSLKATSGNLVLLRMLAETDRAEVVIVDLLRHLPLFNPDIEDTGPAPAPVVAWREALAASDAVVFACPEYGFSLPGALKNGVDWVIGSGELHQKVVAITAAVGVHARGAKGRRALRDTLEAVDARIVWDQGIVERGELAGLVEAVLAGVAAATLEE